MKSILIQVSLDSRLNAAGKFVFVRDVEVHEDVSIDYNQIISVMKVLYGKNSIVKFQISDK